MQQVLWTDQPGLFSQIATSTRARASWCAHVAPSISALRRLAMDAVEAMSLEAATYPKGVPSIEIVTLTPVS